MRTFYVAVYAYDVLVLLAKVAAEKVPALGEGVEVDFANPDTELIEGAWGREAATGSFLFIVTGESQFVPIWNSIPVVESQLELEAEDK